ncbi:MAG: hypothetical protein ACOY3P_24240 [Planctomycetota bacterium]
MRLPAILAALLLAACVSLLPAADPTPEANAPALKLAVSGGLLTVTPELPFAAKRTWRVLPGTGPTRTLILSVATDGDPVVYLYQIGPYGAQPQPEPDPKPDPQPDPKPEPEPQPTPSELWAVVVEESSQRTPEQAAILASPQVRALFPEGRFRVLDQDAQAADAKTYLDRSRGKPLPVLYLIDPQARVHYEGPLPATLEAFTSLLREKGGK